MLEAQSGRGREELEREIERLRQKYGMDFDEFFEMTEGMRSFGELMDRGFDPEEILEDVSVWEDLEEELSKLKCRE